MMHYSLQAVVVFGLMLLLDWLWLGVLARKYYRRTLSRVLSFDVRWWPALLFYVLHTAGILCFVIGWSGNGSVWQGFWRGGLFGLFTYGAYDLTNMATIRNWPWHLTLLDMLWGMFVTALSAGAGQAVGNLI